MRRPPNGRRLAVLPLLAVVMAIVPVRAQDRVVPNDNRVPAGTRVGSLVQVDLVARVAMWHPDGADAPGAPMLAFAEESGPARIPGPLLRAPAGTQAVVRLRNALTDTLRVFGLFGRAEPLQDTMPVVLAPGERRELQLRLDRPGTYLYWGTTTRRSLSFRTGEDSQLSGAIVIDPPGGQRRATPDRVFVVGMWSDTVHRVGTRRVRVLGVINGQSWPGTERLTATVGDTLRWRVINTTADLHPMHLHGAYFRVTRRGDVAVDTAYQPRAGTAAGDLAVTESMSSGQTMLMEWVPERAGNWLFHCHVAEHFERRGPLGTELPGGHAVAHDHAEGGMGGLVMGIAVRPRGNAAAARPARPAPARRNIRLLVRANQSSTDSVPYYGYALHEGGAEPAIGTGLTSAPALDLVRGVPVSITVVNRLPEATAVHWHGIELDSYYDGVPGFSGFARQITPLIAPGDSFVVRFTPPRAGTFIYHTHADEVRQQTAGLVGALIVREGNTPRDPVTDIPIVLTSPVEFADNRRVALINASRTPPPLTMQVGHTYRLRLIQMSVPRAAMSVQLTTPSGLATWRPVAKDGADLPRAARTAQEARAFVAVGETGDFEITPHEPGELRLEVYNGGTLGATPGGPMRRAAIPAPVAALATLRIVVR